jgi:protein-tyrosine phosphatase
MSAHAPERLIRLENAFNVRDLGGYALAGGGETAWRAMLRGDGLHRLGENDVARLLDHGLRTVIDLRSGYELEREPNPFRAHPVVRYHNIALFDALSPIDIVLGAQGSAFDMAARYRDAVDHCSARIVAVLEAMVEADEGAILFHCSAGKDRTGLVAAILLVLAGVDDDQVLDDYALTAKLATPLIEQFRARALARGADPRFVEGFLSSEPATMRSTLDHIANTYGGVQTYLEHAGADAAMLAGVRRRLLTDAPHAVS